MFKIVRSILIVTETVEYVTDRPSRPGGPASTRPVIDTACEALPESSSRIRAASNVADLTPRQRALKAWNDKQLRRIGR